MNYPSQPPNSDLQKKIEKIVTTSILCLLIKLKKTILDFPRN